MKFEPHDRVVHGRRAGELRTPSTFDERPAWDVLWDDGSHGTVFESELRPEFPGPKTKMPSNVILRAIRFAERKHAGQKRKVTGEDYIVHPIFVSYLAARLKKSKNAEILIAAAILHDTVEDTDTTHEELTKEFGIFVASIVFELTSDEAEIAKVGKLTYLKKHLMGVSSYALFLKLCDRLGNLLDHPSEKQVLETVALLVHLKKHRRLSKSHRAVIAEIEERLAKLSAPV